MKIAIHLLLVIGGIGIFIFVVKKTYDIGYTMGFNKATAAAQVEIDNVVALVKNGAISYKKDTKTPTPVAKTSTPPTSKPVAVKWGGPELWNEVNKRRVQLGVNALSQRDELCTVASIRLNQLLELGKLDGHEGFSKLPDERADLKWIYDQYNLSEFLVSGAQSASDAVSLWENTLGHKKLLTGGEYVWGCIYAQNNFAVAIAAY